MRLGITRRADLATKALALLVGAAPGERTKAAELAERLDSSVGVITQAMTPLVAAGWVRSVPGPTGGYVATDAASQASVLDVLEAVDGPIENGRCVLEDRPCAGGGDPSCLLHEPWRRARATLRDELAALGVSDHPLTGANR